MTHEIFTYTCIALNLIAAGGLIYARFNKSFDYKATVLSGVVAAFNLLYVIMDWTLF